MLEHSQGIAKGGRNFSPVLTTDGFEFQVHVGITSKFSPQFCCSVRKTLISSDTLHAAPAVILLFIPPIDIIQQESMRVMLSVLVCKFRSLALAGCLCCIQASPSSLVAGQGAYAPCSKLTSIDAQQF